MKVVAHIVLQARQSIFWHLVMVEKFDTSQRRINIVVLIVEYIIYIVSSHRCPSPPPDSIGKGQ